MALRLILSHLNWAGCDKVAQASPQHAALLDDYGPATYWMGEPNGHAFRKRLASLPLWAKPWFEKRKATAFYLETLGQRLELVCNAAGDNYVDLVVARAIWQNPLTRNMVYNIRVSETEFWPRAFGLLRSFITHFDRGHIGCTDTSEMWASFRVLIPFHPMELEGGKAIVENEEALCHITSHWYWSYGERHLRSASSEDVITYHGPVFAPPVSDSFDHPPMTANDDVIIICAKDGEVRRDIARNCTLPFV